MSAEISAESVTKQTSAPILRLKLDDDSPVLSRVMVASDLVKVNQVWMFGEILARRRAMIVSAESGTAQNMLLQHLINAPRLVPRTERCGFSEEETQKNPARVLDGRYFEDACELTWSS